MAQISQFYLMSCYGTMVECHSSPVTLIQYSPEYNKVSGECRSLEVTGRTYIVVEPCRWI